MSDLISPAALDVLARSTCEGQAVRLPDEVLAREVYEEVADVLGRLGGKWKRRGRAKDGVPQGAHEFPYDPAPLLSAVVETGEQPPKNPTAFFPTPPDVVAQMVEWCELAFYDHPECRILEPSAGTGALADAIRERAPQARLDVVEVLPINVGVLRRKGYEVHDGDFPQWAPEYRYDAVLMNPPFSLEGDPLAYITHILHAWDLLREGGELVSITPTGFLHRQDQKSRDFLAMVGEHGDSGEVPAGAFKESGTTVATRIVWMRKDSGAWKREPHQGWGSWNAWVTNLWASCEVEFDQARHRLFQAIRAGEYRLDLFGALECDAGRAAVRAHFDAVVRRANESFEGVRLTDADHAELAAHLLAEYREWLEWEERHESKQREAA